MNNLFQFLKSEAEGDERIDLAVAGFSLAKKDADRKYRKKRSYTDVTKNLPTASIDFFFQIRSKETLYIL